MDLKTSLINAAQAHRKTTGEALATTANKVINDGKFFSRIERGGGFTVRTYQRFMDYFDKAKEVVK